MIAGRSLALIRSLRRTFSSEYASFSKAMANSTFVSKLNPMTGKMEWQPQDVDYDYHQEIARSAYADMLHDYERNQKYYQGIRKAIDIIHQRGQKVNVLDIGTGTGLLSMMAAASGADKVTACEAFAPMAACAIEVIRTNGFSDKITVVAKRSTDLTVGPEGDMEERANLLVTEVFDTELIGEGAIGTFTHAHLELLTEDCLVVPRAANLYAQPVSSSLVRSWNTVHPITVKPGKVISPPAELSNCGGAASLHDLQLDQLPQTSFQSLHPPVAVFRFDFSKRGALAKERHEEHTLTAVARGNSDAVFMWWDVEMDPLGEITLSCAPSWAHPDGKALPWRDHWMQAIYYPPVSAPIQQGQQFKLVSCRDEYSLWFNVFTQQQENSTEEDHNICSCGFHTSISRTRLAMMNDAVRNNTYIAALRREVTSESVVLTISDGSLLPVMAAMLGAKKVFALEREIGCRRLVEAFVKANELEDIITVLHEEPDLLTSSHVQDMQVTVVVGEPHFHFAMLPWYCWYFHHAVSQLQPLLAPEAVVLPRDMKVKAVGVEFEHLWKIRAPVGRCEGFDIQAFDKLIAGSAAVADQAVEPQPVWEYPSQPLTSAETLITVTWDGEMRGPASSTDLKVTREGKLNGVVLWTEFDFGEGLTISTGPQGGEGEREEGEGGPLDWDKFSRQGVHLLPTPQPVLPGDCCRVQTVYRCDEGDFHFDFLLASSSCGDSGTQGERPPTLTNC